MRSGYFAHRHHRRAIFEVHHQGDAGKPGQPRCTPARRKASRRRTRSIQGLAIKDGRRARRPAAPRRARAARTTSAYRGLLEVLTRSSRATAKDLEHAATTSPGEGGEGRWCSTGCPPQGAGRGGRPARRRRTRVIEQGVAGPGADQGRGRRLTSPTSAGGPGWRRSGRARRAPPARAAGACRASPVHPSRVAWDGDAVREGEARARVCPDSCLDTLASSARRPCQRRRRRCRVGGNLGLACPWARPWAAH